MIVVTKCGCISCFEITHCAQCGAPVGQVWTNQKFFERLREIGPEADAIFYRVRERCLQGRCFEDLYLEYLQIRSLTFDSIKQPIKMVKRGRTVIFRQESWTCQGLFHQNNFLLEKLWLSDSIDEVF